jgi:hypothetical protein
MLRAIPVLAAAAITLVLIPVQWISVALKLPSGRSIPVLYRRVLCALIAIRIREVGERVREHPLLAFRSALIGAARDALAEAEHCGRVLIQPLSVAYTRLHGLPIGRLHRPVAAWYGDMELLPHLIRVLGQGAFDVVLTRGEPVADEAQTDRKEVAKSLAFTVRRLATAIAGRTGAAPAIPFCRESR